MVWCMVVCRVVCGSVLVYILQCWECVGYVRGVCGAWCCVIWYNKVVEYKYCCKVRVY